MDATMTIGQLARKAGVGVETVRYYQRRGILDRPTAVGSRPRRYAQAALATLLYVRRARDLGFTLAEIGELLELRENPEDFCVEGTRTAERKLVQIEKKIGELKAMRRELTRGIEACRKQGGGTSCPGHALLQNGATPSSNGRKPNSKSGHKERDRK